MNEVPAVFAVPVKPRKPRKGTKGAKAKRRRGPVRKFFRRVRRSLGFRADGGAVMPGRPYVVGERGPEILRVSTPGRIETIPGGNGRAAAISRAPGRGFAGIARGSGKAMKWGKRFGQAAIGGGGAFLLGEVFDRVGLAPAVQGGIFAGVALVMAGVGQAAVAAGVGAIALYELMAAGWKWFKAQYPGVVGGGPAPTKPPTA